MEISVEISITPEMLAKSFRICCSDEQVKVFEYLGKEIAGDKYHANTMVSYKMDCKNELAKDTFMDMAAPMFWQTLKYMEKVWKTP